MFSDDGLNVSLCENVRHTHTVPQIHMTNRNKSALPRLSNSSRLLVGLAQFQSLRVSSYEVMLRMFIVSVMKRRYHKKKTSAINRLVSKNDKRPKLTLNTFRFYVCDCAADTRFM